MSFHVRQVTLSEEIPLVSSGEISYRCNDQVINDLARDSDHNSDFPSKQIYDFSITHSKKRTYELFPSPVHLVHLVGQADTELGLLQLTNHQDWN